MAHGPSHALACALPAWLGDHAAVAVMMAGEAHSGLPAGPRSPCDAFQGLQDHCVVLQGTRGPPGLLTMQGIV